MYFKTIKNISLIITIFSLTTLFAENIRPQSIGINTGYVKMYYTCEDTDISKPKTIFYNVELYTIIDNLFNNNSIKPTINYIYNTNQDTQNNSMLVGLTRYDSLNNFIFYSGFLLGYSQLNWEHSTDNKTYTGDGFTGGIQAGIEFPFFDNIKFNVNLKYLVHNYEVDLAPKTTTFTHTGTISVALGLRYTFSYDEIADVKIDTLKTNDDYLTEDMLQDIDNEIILLKIDEELNEMKDSDADGISDMLDNCSDSVLNEIVDEFGCAKDSDDDSVLDRLDNCLESVDGEIVDEFGCAKDSDLDSVVDRLDMCPNSIENEIVDKKGCAKDSDNDAVVDRIDRCPNTPKDKGTNDFGCAEGATEVAIVIEINATVDISTEEQNITFIDINMTDSNTTDSNVTVENFVENNVTEEETIDNKIRYIRFSYKSDDLTEQSQEDIKFIVKTLIEEPSIKILMKSYTDSIGSKEYNLKLSAQRSDVVYKKLLQYDIDKERVIIQNLGESEPIASNMFKKGRKQNRRIEVIFIK